MNNSPSCNIWNDKLDCRNKCKDDDSSSIDTNDALVEMLGLSNYNDLPTSVSGEVRVDVPLEVETIKNLPTSQTIELPVNCSRHRIHPSECLAIRLDDVLSETECQNIIEMAGNRFQYITEASHLAPDGTSFTVEIQNPNPHKLSVIDTHHDPQVLTTKSHKNCFVTSVMDKLFKTIEDSLLSHSSFRSFTKRTNCGKMQGLNPRMRVLKYDARDDDRFDAHFDATTFVPGTDGSRRRKSLITVLLYLNNGDGNDFEGGETFFLQNFTSSKEVNHSTRTRGAIKVVPKTGSALVFEHDLFHAGGALKLGTKYIMRTDILFEENDFYKEGDEKDAKIVVQEEKILVSDICVENKLPFSMIHTLKTMDLFDVTCETLLAPGARLLQQMLLDCGCSSNFVDLLIENAEAASRK